MKCKKCREERRILNQEQICVFCMKGFGGKPIEKEAIEYADGKAIRSSHIEK